MSSLLSWIAGGLIALQSPAPLPEVRQLVSFRFLPGRTAEAIELFRAEALPLYQANEPMLRFRGFRKWKAPSLWTSLWCRHSGDFRGWTARISPSAKKRRDGVRASPGFTERSRP